MTISPELIFKTSSISDGNMSLRFDENNEVLHNRKNFVKDNNFICMRCTHGEKIKIVSEPSLDMPEAEVLITQEKGLALMLLTADCLPTGFYDPITKTIALAHFSRETIANGLPQKTIGFLRQKFNTNPSHLKIFIGPHIKKESYSFTAPLKYIKPLMTPFVNEANNQVHIDLLTAHNRQLITAGVLSKNITASKVDTFVSPEHFSHYESTRDGKKPHGRLATILMMR